MRWRPAKVPAARFQLSPITRGPETRPRPWSILATRADTQNQPVSASSNDQLDAPRPPFPGHRSRAPRGQGGEGLGQRGGGQRQEGPRPSGEAEGPVWGAEGAGWPGSGPGPPGGRVSGDREEDPGPCHALQEARRGGICSDSQASLPRGLLAGTGPPAPTRDAGR